MDRFPYLVYGTVWLLYHPVLQRLQQKTQFGKSSTKMHHNGDNVVFACFFFGFYYFDSSLFAMVSDIFRKDDCCVFLFVVGFILFLFLFSISELVVVVVVALTLFISPLTHHDDSYLTG